MRSRYTAYVVGAIDYIEATQAGIAARRFDRATSAKWSAECEWHRLDVIRTSRGRAGDDRGRVEFAAYYRASDGRAMTLREQSEFRRIGGRWKYVGDFAAREHRDEATPVVGPRTGRNALCPCGSGKKFKRCCGGAAAAGPIDSGRVRRREDE